MHTMLMPRYPEGEVVDQIGNPTAAVRMIVTKRPGLRRGGAPRFTVVAIGGQGQVLVNYPSPCFDNLADAHDKMYDDYLALPVAYRRGERPEA